MTKIPSMYDLPQPRVNVAPGKIVTGTINKKTLRAMVSALESVGLVVRLNEQDHVVCHVNGKVLLHAAKGNNGNYLARYAQGVTKLMEKES